MHHDQLNLIVCCRCDIHIGSRYDHCEVGNYDISDRQLKAWQVIHRQTNNKLTQNSLVQWGYKPVSKQGMGQDEDQEVKRDISQVLHHALRWFVTITHSETSPRFISISDITHCSTLIVSLLSFIVELVTDIRF